MKRRTKIIIEDNVTFKQGYKSIVRFFTGYIKDRYVFFSRSMKIKEMDIIVQNQIYYFILKFIWKT